MARNATSGNNGNDLFEGSDGDDKLPGKIGSDVQLGGLDDVSLSGGDNKYLLVSELDNNLLDGGRDGDGGGAGTLIAIVHVRDRRILSNDDFLAL